MPIYILGELGSVEGGGVTEPDFLDDPEKLFRGGPGALRLDDIEKLVRESVKESFSWFRPKALPRLNGPSINDLVVNRWHSHSRTPEQEVIRCVQARKGMAYDELLARFHRKVLQVAGGHMPRYWRYRRSSLRDKHTNNLLFEDLVAAGVAAMWKATLKLDLALGCRFWTGVRASILGAISDEARIWRRHGSRETRLDRWLYTHPTASSEQVLRAQQRLVRRPAFHSLEEAAEGIKQFRAWGGEPEFEYDTAEADEAVENGGDPVFAGMYSCLSRHTLSPQLKFHERLIRHDSLAGISFDERPDVGNASRPKSPREALDWTETAFIQFKNGKRQVTRQKAASYCYGIVASPELRARALKDLEFAKGRWDRRIRRGPLPAEQYPRWSTKWLNHKRVGQGTLGRIEDENKQIVPAFVPVTQFKWNVECRGAEGNVLQILESPSRHCLKPRPCKICGRSRANNVPRLSVSLSAA